MRLCCLIFICFSMLQSAQRAVWSGFKYSGKALNEEVVTAINSAFRDELVNSGYFEIVDRNYLDNKLLEKIDDNYSYSHQDINAILKQVAQTDFLLWGEATALPDRYAFSVSYVNTINGNQIVSVQNEYAVNAGFLLFHTKELAKELVHKIKNQQPDSFNRKLLKTNRQKITDNGNSFYIDIYEVSNYLFQAFSAETNYQTDAEKIGYGWLYKNECWQKVKGTSWRNPGGPGTSITGMDNHPVIHVSRNDALAYCKWANKRLPTIKEWETAAGGKNRTKYPYGNKYDELQGNYNSGDAGWISKTGVFNVENNGLYDLSGNVSEWTADSATINNQVLFYIKGGNWLSKPYDTETTHLNYQSPDCYFPYLGFRCVSDQ